MLKKVTSILFAVFANAIVLTHLFVPHHHHEQEICYENTHCTNEHTNHDHAEHEHDNSSETQNCVINKLVVPNDLIKKQLRVSFTQKLNDFDTYKALLLSLDANKVSAPFLRGELRASKTSEYIVYASNCLGLRAPPIV